MKFYFPLVVFFLMMSGVYLLLSQCVSIDKALQSSHWAKAEARVVSWDDARKLGAQYDPVDQALTEAFLPSYFKFPHLPFMFSVNGTTYSAVNYTYSIDPVGLKQPDISSDYPIGSLIPIYYDPADPKNAVFKAGLNPHFYLVLATGIVIVLLGGYLLTKPVHDRV